MRARQFNKASLVLASHGYTQSEVAIKLGCDRSNVGHLLAGRIKPTQSFRDALVELGGRDLANEVYAALEAST